MLPMRWDPFRELGREFGSFHREMDDLLRRTFGAHEVTAEEGVLLAPPVNTYARDNTFFVQVEIPGLDKKDIEVSLEGNQLTIRGERKSTREVKEQDYLLRESRQGTFLRRLTLPDGVNTDKVHAGYKDGILEITMPMVKAVGGRKVLIEGAETEKGREMH